MFLYSRETRIQDAISFIHGISTDYNGKKLDSKINYFMKKHKTSYENCKTLLAFLNLETNIYLGIYICYFNMKWFIQSLAIDSISSQIKSDIYICVNTTKEIEEIISNEFNKYITF